MNIKEIQVEERPSFFIGAQLSLQHLLAMFGATVLVPFLFKVDPTTCILMNGIGTLIYILVTKGKIPAYLGSSFAVISPVMIVLGKSGYAAAQSGFIAFGLIFCLFSLLVYLVGTKWIEVIFPPAAMGAIVAIIGLELAPTAAQMAGFTAATIDFQEVGVAMFTLAVIVIGGVAFRGFLAIIPILFGVVCGYLLALVLGMVDLSGVYSAPWFQLPKFYAPQYDLDAIILIIPAALVVLAEHVGHLVVTGNVIGRDLMKDHGLARSLAGDGIATALSGCVGGTPNTTYGENIGVLALTKVYSVWVIGGAALMAIAVSLVGKFSALVRSIPVPVMGGICCLLFGVIAVSGIRIFVDRKVDFSKPANMLMTAVVLSIGLSGAKLTFGAVSVQGMVLATIVAVIMGLVFKIFNFER